jgi:hypothetical protein
VASSLPGNTKVSVCGMKVREMNGFQFANTIIDLLGGVGVFLYVFFVMALVGFFIGVLLLMKKNVPVFLDWLVILFCIGCCIYLASDSPDIFLSGYYVILTGLGIALITQIISLVKKE